jgi:hypothetical protein
MKDTFEVNNLLEDIQATNSIRKFRKSIGSTQRTAYAHRWWLNGMVLLTYFPNGLSQYQIQDEVKLEMDMTIFFPSQQVLNAIYGFKPDNVRREYAEKFPYVAKSTGLSVRPPTESEQDTSLGRPPKHIFYFKSSRQARSLIIELFPDTIVLFAELDRKFRSKS